MKYKITNYNNKYLFVLDENPIGFKRGEYMFDEPDNSEKLYQFTYDIDSYPIGNKVLAHLPINGATELDIVLLPEIDSIYADKINEIYRKESLDKIDKSYLYYYEKVCMERREVAPLFTESDIFTALDELWNIVFLSSNFGLDRKDIIKQNIINRLDKTKYPVAIESDSLKCYTNEIQKLVVRGKYIY